MIGSLCLRSGGRSRRGSCALVTLGGALLVLLFQLEYPVLKIKRVDDDDDDEDVE